MANNPANLLLGTAAFGFNTTLPGTDPDKKASYTVDFGNIKSAKIRTETEKKEHFGSYAGVLKRDKTITIKKKLTYELMLDEFNTEVWAKFMGAASGAAPDPAKPVVGYGWIAAEMVNEPVNTTSDTAIFMHHSFKCTLYLEGELPLDGENFSEVTMLVDVDLGVPGLYTAAARPLA